MSNSLHMDVEACRSLIDSVVAAWELPRVDREDRACSSKLGIFVTFPDGDSVGHEVFLSAPPEQVPADFRAEVAEGIGDECTVYVYCCSSTRHSLSPEELNPPEEDSKESKQPKTYWFGSVALTRIPTVEEIKSILSVPFTCYAAQVEIGSEKGFLHLQFVGRSHDNKWSFKRVRAALLESPLCQLPVFLRWIPRGRFKSCVEYCTKEQTALLGLRVEENLEIVEEKAAGQGKRTDLHEAYDYMKSISEEPLHKRRALLLDAHPNLFIRYARVETALRLTAAPVVPSLPGDPYPFQRSLLDILNVPCTDDRAIHWVYEVVGNVGKSALEKYLVMSGVRTLYVQTITALSNLFYLFDDHAVVIFDIPRETPMSAYSHLFNAAESFKSGKCISEKYECEVKVFRPPHVVFLSNDAPPVKRLSRDRWRIWTINAAKELVALPTPEM